MGEILSRPGKFYRELKEESEVLRRRTEEIEQAMTVCDTDNKPRLAASIAGEAPHTCLQQLRAGDASDGILLGSSADEKLLTIRWQRRVVNGDLSPSSSYSSLSKERRVSSKTSLSSEVSGESASTSVGKDSGGWIVIPGSSSVKGLYQPSPDDIGCELRAEIHFTRQFRLYSPTLLTDKVVHAVASYAVVALAGDVAEAVRRNVEGLEKEFEGVVDMFDPKKVGCLKVEVQDRKMNLCFTKTKVHEEATDSSSVHSNDTLTEEEASEETAVFPQDSVRVQVVGENATHVLVNIKRADETACSLILSTESSRKRDEIILTVRGMRSIVQERLGLPDLPKDYDYGEAQQGRPVSRSSSEFFTGAKALGSSLMRTQRSSSSVRLDDCQCRGKQTEDTVIVLFDGGQGEVGDFCACSCLYSSVAAQVGLRPTESNALFGRPKRSFSDHGLLHFQSMSSLISTAFDPFALQSNGSKRGKRKYRSVYALANFAEPFDVVLNLEDDEGLGIQLGLFNVGKEEAIMCLTGFCPVNDNPGQLESHPKISVGDALVAVNGKEVIEEGQRKGSLKRIVALVNEARAPDEPAQENLINTKATLTFTFAKPVKEPEVEEDIQKELRGLREWKTKALTNNEKKEKQLKELRNELKLVKTKLQKAEDKLEAKARQATEYCEMMEEVKGSVSLVKAEAAIIENERTAIAEKLSQFQVGVAKEVDELKEKLVKAEDTADYWRIEAEKVGKEVINREASMQALAMDGEAFSTALETKEKALRALEEDLNVLRVRNGTLQELLDSTRAERLLEETKVCASSFH